MKKKLGIIIAAVAVAIALIVVLIIGIGNYRKLQAYKEAEALVTAKQFDEAITAFAALGNFRDANEKLPEIYYAKGKHLLSQNDYDAAIAAYEMAGGYKDAAEKVQEVKYVRAEQMVMAEKFMDAANEFTLLGDYKGSKDRAKEAMFLYAKKLMDGEKTEDGLEIIKSLNDYPPAINLLEAIQQKEDYDKAEALLAEGKYKEAAEAYNALGEFKDSREKSQLARYKLAEMLMEKEAYEPAVAVLNTIADYPDAKALLEKAQQEANYVTAKLLMEEHKYEQAADAFAALGEFKEARTLAGQCYLEHAKALLKEKKLDAVVEILKKVPDNSEATALLAEVEQELAYAAAQKLFADKNYLEAARAFAAIGSYQDAATQAERSYYEYAQVLTEEKKVDKAIEILEKIPKYPQSRALLNKLNLEKAYQDALALLESKEYQKAAEAFLAMGDYKDAKQQSEYSYYLLAKELADAGKKKEAKEILKLIPGYKDTQSLLDTLQGK